MKINEVVEVSEKIELNEDTGFVKDLVNRLGRMSWDSAKNLLKQKARDFISYVKGDNEIDANAILRLINTRLGTHFTTLDSVITKALGEGVDRCDEGLKDWWHEASVSMYGALSFYPLLTVFLELDKIIKGSGDANIRSMMIYFIIWVLIVSGKVVSGIIANKSKESPESWDKMMRGLENNQ